MRVNVYAEELTDKVEIITKRTPDGEFTGVRFWLELPVTCRFTPNSSSIQVKGPFMHHENDNDSSAITIWGKQDLKKLLKQALDLLEKHYSLAIAKPDDIDSILRD